MSTLWAGFYIVLIGIALVGLAAILTRYRREIRSAQERLNRMNSQMIDTNCGPIEYLRVGEGYPVLVVRGALGDFDQGLWLAQGVGPDIPDPEIICLSRFGHLRSPAPAKANLDSQAYAAFACLLDALRHNNWWHSITRSPDDRAAIQCAEARHRVDRLRQRIKDDQDYLSNSWQAALRTAK
jgi:hypothetical protein